jgi:protein-S-isoprenylcysteine O-methyltransferase Ste14
VTIRRGAALMARSLYTWSVSTAAYITLAAWALLEACLRAAELLRGKGGGARDRATRIWIGLGIGAAIAVALLARSTPPAALRVAGVVVMWLGLALRAWAIASLGASFRTTVEVDPGQAVVARGPYRWIRHPSYTGLLTIVAGFGLVAGGWLSLVACLILPLPAIVWRIRVEEAELERVLGDAYRGYASGRARLIPRLW